MKELWYAAGIVFMLTLFASLTNLSTPTSAFAVNLPPQWDFPTTDFTTINGEVTIDLTRAFFDPDSDPLAFSVVPEEGIAAGIKGDILVAYVEKDSTMTISASDGKVVVSKQVNIYVA